MKPSAPKQAAHVHEYRYAGRERLKYGEVLNAVCHCGWRKLTAIAEVPPKFGVGIGRTSARYKPSLARKRRPAPQV